MERRVVCMSGHDLYGTKETMISIGKLVDVLVRRTTYARMASVSQGQSHMLALHILAEQLRRRGATCAIESETRLTFRSGKAMLAPSYALLPGIGGGRVTLGTGPEGDGVEIVLSFMPSVIGIACLVVGLVVFMIAYQFPWILVLVWPVGMCGCAYFVTREVTVERFQRLVYKCVAEANAQACEQD